MYPVALGPVAASVGLRSAGGGSGRGPGLGQRAGLGRDPACSASTHLRLDVASPSWRRPSSKWPTRPALSAARLAWPRLSPSYPAGAAVLVEIGAEAHAAWEVRLFAS